MINIDPVVMKEEKARADKRAQANGLIQQSTSALSWFAEHAINSDHQRVNPDALESKTTNIVASATTNADKAGWYISKARAAMRADIIERAIQLAQADLAAAKEAIK